VRHSIARFSLASVLAVTACNSGYVRTAPPLHPDSLAIRRDIEYLASDRLEGRLTGMPGNDTAAAYLARRYKSLGLAELTPGYLQPFDAR